MDLEYICSEHAIGDYRVTKLQDGEKQLEQYSVTVDPRERTAKARCDCMAWISGKTRPCKHIRLVSRWLGEGKPTRSYDNSQVRAS